MTIAEQERRMLLSLLVLMMLSHRAACFVQRGSVGHPRNQRMHDLIMAASQSLNHAQKEAALAPLDCASICVAGPGSGKTKVLTTRIAHMIKTLNIKPYNILAITFTNKAAREMKSRLTSILGDEALGVEIGTFHSFGSRLLRQAGRDHLRKALATNGEIVADTFDENFVVFDQTDCLKLTKELMASADIADSMVKPLSCLNAIGNIREARAMSLTTAAEKGEYANALSKTSRVNRAAFTIVEEYERKLRASNALDFQDLLIQTYNLLRIPEVNEKANNRYLHVLVDEYQDTNVPQYEIVRLLQPSSLMGAGPASRSLFCVGDQNQAIYSWRGARVGNMAQLVEDYPGMQTYGLLENYRCSPAVTAVANAILGTIATKPHNPKRRFEPARIIACQDDQEQAQCVAKLLKTLRGKAGAGDEEGDGGTAARKTREIAIMYRTNAQSRVLEAELVKAGIKHVLLGGRRFFDRKEVKDLLSFLRLLQNPHDRLSCSRAMEEFGVGVGAKTIGMFFSWVEASSKAADSSQGGAAPSILSHFEALVSWEGMASEKGSGQRLAEPPQEITKRGEKALGAFAEQILALRVLARTATLPELVAHIKEVFFSTDYIKRNCKTANEAEERLGNIEELLKATQKYAALKGEGCLDGQLVQFLEEAALLSGDDDEAEAAAAAAADAGIDVVYLMTIHASKGLEFDTVMLTGCEESTLPLLRGPDNGSVGPDDDNDEVAEERRLAFVAVTRAKSLLFLMHRQQVVRFQDDGGSKSALRTTTCKPSRFLANLAALGKESVVSLKWKSS